MLLLVAATDAVEVPGDYPSWRGYCPCHDDRRSNRSLNIDYKPSRYGGGDWVPLAYCRTCGREKDLGDFCEAVGLAESRIFIGNERLKKRGGFSKPKRIAPIPRPCDVARWREQLHTRPELLTYLREQRGLTLRTIRRYRLGYDRGRYMLPVFSNGRIVNVRRYKPNAEAGLKMINVPGLGKPARLYPHVPTGSSVVLCEGEWDALVTLQHRLPAVTSTHGVLGWRDEWNELFACKSVAIIYDCDGDGRAASQGRAEALSGIASKVRVVDLGLGNKEDLTDWFVKYERSHADLLSLITNTPEWS